MVSVYILTWADISWYQHLTGQVGQSSAQLGHSAGMSDTQRAWGPARPRGRLSRAGRGGGWGLA